jgi:hypothetical protein
MNCDWCSSSLSNTIVYDLHTRINDNPITYTIGVNCCITSGKHADFANKHNCPPMNFQPRTNVDNVNRLFAVAHNKHKTDPSDKTGETRVAFKTAYRMFRKLSAAEKLLVTR